MSADPETEVDISPEVHQIREWVKLAIKKSGDDPVAKAAIVSALACVLGEALGDLSDVSHELLDKKVVRTCEEVGRVATRRYFDRAMGRGVAA